MPVIRNEKPGHLKDFTSIEALVVVAFNDPDYIKTISGIAFCLPLLVRRYSDKHIQEHSDELKKLGKWRHIAKIITCPDSPVCSQCIWSFRTTTLKKLMTRLNITIIKGELK